MRRAPCRPGRKRKSLGSAFAYHMVLTCVALPSKKKDISPTFCTNLPLEAPLPVYFSCIYDVPSFCHDSSHTSDPKMHHPVMDSLVLSLQCGKATAFFVTSIDCDIVAEVSKCGSSGLDLIFSVLYPSNLLLYEQVREYESCIFYFLFRFRAARYIQMVPFDI